MAVAFRAVASSTLGSGTALAITKPVGLALNDCMLAVGSGSGTASGLDKCSAETGWAFLFNNDHSTGDSQSFLAWKVADADDVAATDFTFTWDSSLSFSIGSVSAFSGTHATSPIDASASLDEAAEDSPATVVCPDITVVVADCLIFRATSYFMNGNPGFTHVISNAGSHTERLDVENSPTGTAVVIALYTEDSLQAPGATGTETITGTGGAGFARNLGHSVSLAPGASVAAVAAAHGRKVPSIMARGPGPLIVVPKLVGVSSSVRGAMRRR